MTEVYRRRLPNALSRMLECTWLAGRFDGDSPLLVLGPQEKIVKTNNFLLHPECRAFMRQTLCSLWPVFPSSQPLQFIPYPPLCSSDTN